MIGRDTLIAWLVALSLLLSAGGVAQAGTFGDALNGFTEGSLSDTGEAIEAVVASGDPRAKDVLEALRDARLMFSAERKLVAIKAPDGKLIDPASKAPLTGA